MSQEPSYRYQYGGKMVSTKIQDPTFQNIGLFSKITDLPILLGSILVIEVIVIFFSRYFPHILGKNINKWYDEFGINAVIADVLIVFIGFLIARFAWSSYFQEKYGWNILYFIGLVVFIQALHDLFFYNAIIKPLPKGHNEMIDVMKDYSEEASGKAVFSDSLIVIGSGLLASVAKGLPFEWQVAMSAIAAYIIPYILYTPAKFPIIPKDESQKEKQDQGQMPVKVPWNPRY